MTNTPLSPATAMTLDMASAEIAPETVSSSRERWIRDSYAMYRGRAHTEKEAVILTSRLTSANPATVAALVV